MKNSVLLNLMLAASILIGFSGCSFNENSKTRSEKTRSQIRISGSGSTYPLFKSLAAAYEKKHPQTKIIFNPSNQSSGGIAGVNQDVIDIGVIARKLTPEELAGIEYRSVALDAVILATHRSVSKVKNLTTEQIKGIYSGEINNWQELGGPDKAIILLDRAEQETAKIALRRNYLGKDLKVTSKAIVLLKESYVVNILKDTRYTIGPISLVQAIKEELPINVLSLDGIEPTQENVANGQYKMTRVSGFVWKGDPKPEVQKFIDYISSPEAKEEIKKVGYTPIEENK